MQAITTVGLDIAKSVFQVHAVDAAGKVVLTSASEGVADDREARSASSC